MRISDWSSDVCSSDLIFAVEIADASGADRAHEGHARNGERSRRRDHCEDVGLIMAVIAQHLSDGVDLVIETFGEQRADRTVDQAADQGFLFGRDAFALRSEENTSELQSLMSISYAVFCLKQKKKHQTKHT